MGVPSLNALLLKGRKTQTNKQKKINFKLLCCNSFIYYSYQDDLHKVGRAKASKHLLHFTKGHTAAENLIQRGYGYQVITIDPEMCVYSVPSETSSCFYRVDLARSTCECVAAAMEGEYVYHKTYLIAFC